MNKPVTLTIGGLSHSRALELSDEIDERYGEALAVAVNETDETAALWNVVAYCLNAEQAKELRDILVSWGMGAGDLQLGDLPEVDWVRRSLEGLPPVEAGRFFLYGAHDRHLRRSGGQSIEIGAGTAFGTGHHGTTAGCLLALDAILKRGRPKRTLDVGCGTGVLAIAAARALHSQALASDIDPEAVEVTRRNSAINGVSHLVRPLCATGLDAPAIRDGGPYDLVFANILARPLIALASGLGAALASGGHLILSGITLDQEKSIRATYRNRGLVPERIIRIGNWVTLVLTR